MRVLLTRPGDRDRALAARLESHGTQVDHAPLIAFDFLSTDDVVRATMLRLAGGEFSWLVLTSPTGVEALARALAAEAKDPTDLADQPIAVVGRGTARAVRERGLTVTLQPIGPAASGSALAGVFPPPAPTDRWRRVLLARSALGSAQLAERIGALGYRVKDLATYTTIPLELPGPVARDLAAGRIDAVVAASGSAVQALAPHCREVPCLVVIGEPTARAAREVGFARIVTAASTDDAGLADAILSAV